MPARSRAVTGHTERMPLEVLRAVVHIHSMSTCPFGVEPASTSNVRSGSGDAIFRESITFEHEAHDSSPTCGCCRHHGDNVTGVVARPARASQLRSGSCGSHSAGRAPRRNSVFLHILRARACLTGAGSCFCCAAPSMSRGVPCGVAVLSCSRAVLHAAGPSPTTRSQRRVRAREGHVDRAGQRRRIAADEDVAVDVAGDCGQLGRRRNHSSRPGRRASSCLGTSRGSLDIARVCRDRSRRVDVN